MFRFYTLWKRRKTSLFPKFSGVYKNVTLTWNVLCFIRNLENGAIYCIGMNDNHAGICP